MMWSVEGSVKMWVNRYLWMIKEEWLGQSKDPCRCEFFVWLPQTIDQTPCVRSREHIFCVQRLTNATGVFGHVDMKANLLVCRLRRISLWVHGLSNANAYFGQVDIKIDLLALDQGEIFLCVKTVTNAKKALVTSKWRSTPSGGQHLCVCDRLLEKRRKS